MDGFTQTLISTGGGKGFGGGKGGNQYVYAADVIAALCNGPLVGIGDVWSGQSWLSNSVSSETWTITAGVYSPLNAPALTADRGVGTTVPYAGLFADLGANTPTNLAGNHIVSLVRVPYGTALKAGQYSINPANNQYNFATADFGKTVSLHYSYDLTLIKRQTIAIIPAGGSIPLGSTTSSSGSATDIPFSADGGVIYYSPTGSNPKNGEAFVGIPVNSPIGEGQYTISGTNPAQYNFSTADVGQEVLITYELNNTNAIPQGTSTTLQFIVFDGYLGQQPWVLLPDSYPGADFGYSGIAYVGYGPMGLGYSAQLQQNIFEVFTGDAWGGGIADCNPVQCILQVLTNGVWGLGAGAVPFPSSAIDNGTGGTWGAGMPTGAPLQDGTATSWFAANGFFISPVIDRQDTAASLIGRWLEAGQCAAFMSEGLLKLVPYGDTSTAGNGAVWVAPSSFVTALDDSCFIPKSEGQDPVKPSSSPWQDAYNVVQVQWKNPSNQYAPEITPESDQAAINRYGSRIEDPQTWDFITSLPAATFAASMRVKRNVYTRNTYDFTVSYRYSYLEPMDVVYITTSSLWAAGSNNQNLNINQLPVRVTKIVDNPDGTLDITAEDYPFGVHQPTIYNKALAAGVAGPNLYADPGNSEVVLFEASDRLTGYKGNEIWIGATGANKDWGGCNVLVSMDGDKYQSIGTIEAPARIGELGVALPAGSDPDTADSVVFDLVESSAPLEAGTQADADADNTLCFVDGELLSYSACTATGQDQYTATGYTRRGRMGSTIAAHAAGGLVMRLDAAVFKYTYDPSWAGKTLPLKFQSFNNFGNSAQDPSTLTAVPFTVPGLNPGTIDASTGLIIGLNSGAIPPNVPYNTGNNCTLASAWAPPSGSGATTGSYATVTGYGPGGAGTAWDFLTGQGPIVYPAFTIQGLPGGTVYTVTYDTQTKAYGLATQYSGTLSDYIIVLGTVTTATGTTSGTGTGGGPTGGNPPRNPTPAPGQPVGL